MKVVTHKLSKDLDFLNIHIFADEHVGDANSDIRRIKDRVDKVLNDPNGYCILNGDILDYTSKTSIGDIESRKLNINGQIDAVVKLFEPIKHKILGITPGNHEKRAYKKEGIDILKLVAQRLGLEDLYSSEGELIVVSFGRCQGRKERHDRSPMTYTIYMVHGTGGGRKEGAKIIRLADMASIIDADVYVHAHTHLPGVIKEDFYRYGHTKKTVKQITKLFVNAASNLDYGGYGQENEYKPSSKDMPLIILDGHIRKMHGIV